MGHILAQQVYEKIVNITNHHRKANENYKEISLHIG